MEAATIPAALAAASPAVETGRSRRVGHAWLFAATVFTGAFLLFQVQPLIGKYVLPWFGGGPAVWTTCMLFFQVLLLGGYAYAHLLSSWLPPRRQVAVHLVVLVAALCLLPIWPSDRMKPVGLQRPTSQILLLLTACVGLPYFALSATGPLMQAWFGRVCPGTSPYRLYALSNVGSLLALLTFPFVFEPNLARRDQALLWSAGLGLFALLCAACGRLVWRARTGEGATDAAAATGPVPAVPIERSPGMVSRALWVLLPACASALLLAVTNKLCQDVAVVPFLWILPLAVYLLTFIISFDSPRWYWRPVFFPLLAAALWVLTRAQWWGANSDVNVALQVLTYCGALFACCMVCHGELVRLRPPASGLTGFYLAISAGGALGGLFVSVVAPSVFPDFFELHVALFACAVLAVAALMADPVSPLHPRGTGWDWPSVVPVGGTLVALIVGTAWLGRTLYGDVRRTLDEGHPSTRNFYGVLRVYEEDWGDGTLRRLQHGAILHGAQFVGDDRELDPITYYGPTSGVGLAMGVLHERPRVRVGVVGLGVGTMAAFGRPGDTVRFYEIDPAVRDVATTRFSYLGKSKAAVEVELGDARLSLEHEPPQQFDLLALDAFSSDAIPVHLLTREAFKVYERHLKPDGILAVHVSNRHLDLTPVVQKLAGELGYHAVWVEDQGDEYDDALDASDWILLARDARVLDAPSIRSVAQAPPEGGAAVRLWTDDDTNLFQVLRPWDKDDLNLFKVLRGD